MNRDEMFLKAAGHLHHSLKRCVRAGMLEDVDPVLCTLQNEVYHIHTQLDIPRVLFVWAMIQKSRELAGEPLRPYGG